MVHNSSLSLRVRIKLLNRGARRRRSARAIGSGCKILTVRGERICENVSQEMTLANFRKPERPSPGAPTRWRTRRRSFWRIMSVGTAAGTRAASQGKRSPWEQGSWPSRTCTTRSRRHARTNGRFPTLKPRGCSASKPRSLWTRESSPLWAACLPNAERPLLNRLPRK